MKSKIIILSCFLVFILFASGCNNSSPNVDTTDPASQHSATSTADIGTAINSTETTDPIIGDETPPPSGDSVDPTPNIDPNTNTANPAVVSTNSNKPTKSPSSTTNANNQNTPPPQLKTDPPKPPAPDNTQSGNDGFTWDKGIDYTGSISINQATAPGTAVKAASKSTIDYSNVSSGYVMIKKNTDVKTKIRVTGPNGSIYQRYILPASGVFYPIPLQMGNGSYTVSVFTNITGDSYAKDAEVTFNSSFSGSDISYLYPNIYANYNSNSSSVRKAFGLCANANSDLDRVKSVYNYIITTIKYDHPKASNVSTSYVPDPDVILSTQKGICFDYACLMATMLRSQGVKTKIVFGYAGSEFHAWNEVYIAGQGWIAVGIPSNGGWKRLDSTFGVSASAAELEKDSKYNSTEYY